MMMMMMMMMMGLRIEMLQCRGLKNYESVDEPYADVAFLVGSHAKVTLNYYSHVTLITLLYPFLGVWGSIKVGETFSDTHPF